MGLGFNILYRTRFYAGEKAYSADPRISGIVTIRRPQDGGYIVSQDQNGETITAWISKGSLYKRYELNEEFFPRYEEDGDMAFMYWKANR